jgi:hypothetical protein
MFYKSKKSASSGIKPRTSRRESSHLNPFASSADAKWTKLKTLSTTQPGGCWRTSGAGPAAPPAPAITSPARASTWISLKPRSAAKQGLEQRMWRTTADRWRNSPRLERWPVAVQWTQTKRPTGAGGTAAGPASASEKRTSRNNGYNEYKMDYNGLQHLDLKMNIQWIYNEYSNIQWTQWIYKAYTMIVKWLYKYQTMFVKWVCNDDIMQFVTQINIESNLKCIFNVYTINIQYIINII